MARKAQVQHRLRRDDPIEILEDEITARLIETEISERKTDSESARFNGRSKNSKPGRFLPDLKELPSDKLQILEAAKVLFHALPHSYING